jgi:hypothetical protein
LGFSLQVALATNLCLCPFVEKDGFVTDLGELKPISGFLHDGMAIDARDPTPCMGTCLPVGLNTAFMALKAGLVLNCSRLTGILAEGNHPADTFSPSGSHVIASRTMAGLTGLLF